jgi:hypothetical protein
MPAKTKAKPQPAKASKGPGKAAKSEISAKKTAAKAAVKAAPTVKRKPAASKTAEPKPLKTLSTLEITISSDDIALRAYYIAERRLSMGWGGDEHSDWVEAESQLLAEAKRKRLRE